MAEFDLDNSQLLLKETFRDSQLVFIENYVKSLLDSEDFSKFSKYTKNLVIEYYRAFLNRLVSQIWQHFSDRSKTPEQFFSDMTVLMSLQLNRVKMLLLERNMLSDLMSDATIRHKLEGFFAEVDDRAEFKKASNGYLNIKSDFKNIVELTEAYSACGQQMIKNAEYLVSNYLKHKEAKFKEMGFDVVLEYFSVDNFNFIYRDPRLHDEQERAKYETMAMNSALKASMPGFTGDISVFASIVKNIK